jgi:serine/threonine-protein kinase HipA
MPRCPITYKKLISTRYSRTGLRLISSKISDLQDIDLYFKPETTNSSFPENKKCFARLLAKENRFISGDETDRYIFIDNNNPDKQFNYNRDLTLKLAKLSGIKTVVHGLAHGKNDALFFWYKRAQFYGRYSILPVANFSDFLDAGMPNIWGNLTDLINKKCTFPALEKLKLLRLCLFSFLIGNGSITLRDLAIIKRKDISEIAPVWQLLNRAIYQGGEDNKRFIFLGQEICLKTRADALIFATENLKVNPKAFNQILTELDLIYLKWLKVIEISFLNTPIKTMYVNLLRKRRKSYFKF